VKSRPIDPGVQALMGEARTLPDCAARDALWERVAAAAESLEDLDTAWVARCNILESSTSHAAPRFENLFLCLAWCLAVSDREPDRFSAQRILWQYKWVATAAPEYAKVPRSVLDRIISDMDERFVRAGWGHRAGVHKRLQMHQLMGELDRAQALVARWRATPRDRGADCSACEASGLAELLADLGQDEQAIREARPIILGRLTCATVPHGTFGNLLLPLVRLHRLDQARDLYDRGRRLVASMENGGALRAAPYLVYAAWAGDIDQARAILRARLPEAVSFRSDHDRHRWFGHAAVALDLLSRHGHGTLDLPCVPGFIDEPTVKTPQLAASCRAVAHRHAAALDQRNDNTYAVDWLNDLGKQWSMVGPGGIDGRET
jgi:hypothetical protein